MSLQLRVGCGNLFINCIDTLLGVSAMNKKNKVNQKLQSSWEEYIEELKKQQALLNTYGQRRSGFLGLWGARNAARVADNKIDEYSRASMVHIINHYNHLPSWKRLLARTFTPIKKQIALYTYLETQNVINKLLSQNKRPTDSELNELLIPMRKLQVKKLSFFSKLTKPFKHIQSHLLLTKINNLKPSRFEGEGESNPLIKFKPAIKKQKQKKQPQQKNQARQEFAIVPIQVAKRPAKKTISASNALLKRFQDSKRAFENLADNVCMNLYKVEEAAYKKYHKNNVELYKQTVSTAAMEAKKKIHKEYLKRAVKYHPDKNHNAQETATEYFKEFGKLHNLAMEKLDDVMIILEIKINNAQLQKDYEEIRKEIFENIKMTNEIRKSFEEIAKAFDRQEAELYALRQSAEKNAVKTKQLQQDILEFREQRQKSLLEHEIMMKKNSMDIAAERHKMQAEIKKGQEQSNARIEKLEKMFSVFAQGTGREDVYKKPQEKVAPIDDGIRSVASFTK